MANINTHHHTLNAHPADETPFSPTQVQGDLDDKNTIGVQAEWSGVTGGLDGTVTLEQSIDGSSWSADGVSGTINVNSASGNSIITVTDFAGRFLRVVYTHGTITAGTVNVHVNAK